MQNTHNRGTAAGRADLTLRGGERVSVRRVRAEDAPALQRLVARSSDRSVELRFFGPMKELSNEAARRFADVDEEQRFALVAVDPDEGEIVGVARYAREGDTDGAEYAALIEDRFQGKGLGVALTRLLVQAARERGVRRLHALVMRDNVRMLRLLRSLGLPERRRWEEGLEHVEVDL